MKWDRLGGVEILGERGQTRVERRGWWESRSTREESRKTKGIKGDTLAWRDDRLDGRAERQGRG